MTSFIAATARAKHNTIIAWMCLVVALFFATGRFDVVAQTPAPSPTTAPAAVQTPLSPEAVEAAEAMKRSRRQADNPYRWIKILGDSKRKTDTAKPEPVKPRPRNEPLSTEASKTESRPSLATAPAPAPETTIPGTTAASSSASTPSGPTAGTVPVTAETVSPTTVAPTAPPPTAAAKAPPEDEADGELKPISTPPPEFPRELRNTVTAGKVTVAFTVQTNGTVGAVSAEYSTNRRLRKAALDAVAQWKFEPIASAETYKVEFNFSQD